MSSPLDWHGNHFAAECGGACNLMKEMLNMLKRVYEWDHITPFGGELRALIQRAEGEIEALDV